jgi:hypothetical protein
MVRFAIPVTQTLEYGNDIDAVLLEATVELVVAPVVQRVLSDRVTVSFQLSEWPTVLYCEPLTHSVFVPFTLWYQS